MHIDSVPKIKCMIDIDMYLGWIGSKLKKKKAEQYVTAEE